MPLKHLKDTIRQWNTYVDEGNDPDFGRGKDAPMHKIGKPPFYAAAICPVWHDSYGGLRINGKAQVLDTQGAGIPGLFSGGQWWWRHGLGRALVRLHRRHQYRAGARLKRSRMNSRWGLNHRRGIVFAERKCVSPLRNAE